MRITLLSTIALLSLTGTAAAAPTPVSEEDLNRPVSVEVSILDAAGATVDTLSCDWATGGPQAADVPCLRFQGDPQTAFAAIEAAGGVRATQTTTTTGPDTVAHITYARRGDGTWLIRGKATVDGTVRQRGYVCAADGQDCVRWDAEGRYAAADVRAAASRLKTRR
jgi:hypothetical protein